MPFLELSGVHKRFGQIQILRGLDLAVDEHDRDAGEEQLFDDGEGGGRLSAAGPAEERGVPAERLRVELDGGRRRPARLTEADRGQRGGRRCLRRGRR